MPGSLFDIKVWIAAVFTTHPFHPRARQALQALYGAVSDARPPSLERFLPYDEGLWFLDGRGPRHDSCFVLAPVFGHDTKTHHSRSFTMFASINVARAYRAYSLHGLALTALCALGAPLPAHAQAFSAMRGRPGRQLKHTSHSELHAGRPAP